MRRNYSALQATGQRDSIFDVWVKFFTLVGAVAGGAGVALSALSAHALRQRIDPAGLATLDTASRYLLVHGLLLLVIAYWARSFSDALSLKIAGLLACTGIVLFCGGLAVGTLSGLRFFATAAPLGGSALMGAWLAVAFFAVVKL